MKQEAENYRLQFNNKEKNAHNAFAQKNFRELAQSLFYKGMIASSVYRETGLDEWDMRTYGAFNAAGGTFESIGNNTNANACYRFALASCERISTGRSPEWQKNINHLKYLIERTSSQGQV